MLRIFNNDIVDPNHFVVTLELVPGRESTGRSVDTITGIARDAFSDGRISAVSITDNPGGNPSLSPDVLSHEIFSRGMDVIVHFTCRDMNRVGMESRALQLARMGIKNILALTGDYSGKGFGGQGAPVFDLDSVILTAMFQKLNERLLSSGDPDGFFTGCAVSPFKNTEAECEAQYRKLERKVEAGASFIITQLGYDVDKFEELLKRNRLKGITAPVLASVYLLSPRAAKAMYRGKVPGAKIYDRLFNSVMNDWKDGNREGLNKSIERTAKMAVILKGIGYKGIHIGGIHRSFKAVGAILDRMEKIEHNWQDYIEEFRSDCEKCFYLYRPSCYEVKKPADSQGGKNNSIRNHESFECTEAEISYNPQYEVSMAEKMKEKIFDHYPYFLMKKAHDLFFNRGASLAPLYRTISEIIDKYNKGWMLKMFVEDPFKKLALSCQSCGDCGIQHLAFQCPESGCPKHTRNGACGGSQDGFCEVNRENRCVWVRAWSRLKRWDNCDDLSSEFVPPRMWELHKTSSWINFHLERDHQKTGAEKS